MFWTLFDAGCSICIFSIGVSLPLVLGGVVYVHRRTFLFANTVIVEVLASLKITKIKIQLHCGDRDEEAGVRKFAWCKKDGDNGIIRQPVYKAIHGK